MNNLPVKYKSKLLYCRHHCAAYSPTHFWTWPLLFLYPRGSRLKLHLRSFIDNIYIFTKKHKIKKREPLHLFDIFGSVLKMNICSARCFLFSGASVATSDHGLHSGLGPRGPDSQRRASALRHSGGAVRHRDQPAGPRRGLQVGPVLRPLPRGGWKLGGGKDGGRAWAARKCAVGAEMKIQAVGPVSDVCPCCVLDPGGWRVERIKGKYAKTEGGMEALNKC